LATIFLAVLITLPAALVLPIYARLAQSPITLAANWGWIVLAIFLFNGLAEESLFRGFVFGRLRRGCSFWRAATLSMFYFAAAHVPLLITIGPVIGALGILFSIPIAYVTAYLFERGANTWWGPAVLHTITNAIPSVVFLSPEAQGTATSLYLLINTLVNVIVLAVLYRRSALRSAPILVGSGD
jgi:membrane protease YdiL (CAAX protease family)